VSKTRYITVKLTEYEACEITSTMLAWGYQRVTNRIVSKIHKELSLIRKERKEAKKCQSKQLET
jgi:hypothetical protein